MVSQPQAVSGPGTWTPQSAGGKEGLVCELGERHFAAFDALLADLRGRALEELGRDDFAHGELAAFYEHVRREVIDGKGAIVIRALDRSRYSQVDCERIFWGIGTQIGKPAIQSSRLDRLGYVQAEENDPQARGYRSAGELVLHTDSRPIVGLMSLQKAARGGLSQVASAAAIHNIILRERPDLMDALYRGYPYHSTEGGLTPCAIPVFSQVDGVLSCAYFQSNMRKAAKLRGETLAPDLDEALTFFAAVAAREDVRIEFMLEPGEIMICNNLSTLHARTHFENAPGQVRLLARLWLNITDERPAVPELFERSRRFDRKFDPLFVEGV